MRAALVAVLVLLAGCNGFAGTETRTTASVTPAPVPSSPDYPPGVTENGVVDASRLASAHARAVSNQSYTLRSNRTVRYTNGTIRSRLTVSVQLAANRSYLVHARTTGDRAPTFLGRPPANATFWSNGSQYVRAYTINGETTYNSFEPPDQFIATWRYWVSTAAFGGEGSFAQQKYEQTFSSVDTRITRVDSPRNETLFRVVGRPTGDPQFLPADISRVRNLTVVSLVTSAGLVRSYRVQYVGVVNGERVRVRWTVDYSRVGSTTIERPSWYGRAVDQDDVAS